MPLQQHSAPYAHAVFTAAHGDLIRVVPERGGLLTGWKVQGLSLIHISEPTRRRGISYAVFCLKKKITN